MACHRIGVDVEQLSVLCHADAAHDRHEAVVHQRLEQTRVRLAAGHSDTSKLDRSAVYRLVRRREIRQTASTIRAGQGIPDDQVWRLQLDTMVDPPALQVATSGGAAVLRVLP